MADIKENDAEEDIRTVILSDLLGAFRNQKTNRSVEDWANSTVASMQSAAEEALKDN